MMDPKRIPVRVESHATGGADGRFYLSDCTETLEALLPEFEGRIRLIYMDPPYLTGERFNMRVKVGEEGWRTGRSTLVLESYVDSKDRAAYLERMRTVLTLCRRLLSDEGMIFVHIDYRIHPHMRLLLDDLFGEDNFLNEIIWVYQTGGRSVRHFSRKHDVILFYRKTEKYAFDIDAVKCLPVQPKSNHMRRHVDPDGRVYRSIRVGERVYTYYDDDPVAPSDVWSDLSHLQQKDPERTGYDTQKPLALLDRIVRCASAPGDWVLDPFAGSSTTLEAAKRCGRRYIGIDSQPLTLNIARRRLSGAGYALYLPEDHDEAEPVCDIAVRRGVGFYHVELRTFDSRVKDLIAHTPMDCVDNWSVGYLRDGVYHVMAEYMRSRKNPALEHELMAPMYKGELVACINDVLGRSFYYALDTQMST